MARIRIVLTEMPPLLRDLLRDSLEQHPALVVEDERVGESLLALVQRREMDVLILAGSSGREQPVSTRAIDEALFARPRLRILTVSGSGRAARLHELRPSRRLIADVTPAGVARAIMDLVQAER